MLSCNNSVLHKTHWATPPRPILGCGEVVSPQDCTTATFCSATLIRGLSRCSDCLLHPRGTTARSHRDINRLLATLDERRRRLFVGFLAREQGRGAIRRLARVTGLSRNTIRRGLREWQRPTSPANVRRPGGGRKPVEEKGPGIAEALDDLLQDAVAGDPITGLKWTHKSTRRLSKSLAPPRFPGLRPTPWPACCVPGASPCEPAASSWRRRGTVTATGSSAT